MDGFKSSLEKENDNWSLKLSWESPKTSGDSIWENCSAEFRLATEKNLLCIKAENEF